MKDDEDLQRNVQNAIKWEPLLHAAEIGVIVNDGVITLTGIVDSYIKKSEAENAAKNVAGVKAVVEKIEVKFGNSFTKSDNEIAAEVVNALKLGWQIPEDKIKVTVEDGWVTLGGELSWNYQKEAAKKAVSNLAGVRSVTNDIRIKSETNEEIEKRDVEKALARNWSLNTKDIEVKVSGTNVKLIGTVDSLYQKEEAGRIAWNTPGVCTVNNDLIVEYDYSYAD
jgi:osmotically-inducible protein OsmY